MSNHSDLYCGKSIIIGLTFINSRNKVEEIRELYGTIQEIKEDGIYIDLSKDGEVYVLPPDLSAVKEAPPGEYRFQSTGEVMADPDYMACWTIHIPKKNKK